MEDKGHIFVIDNYLILTLISIGELSNCRPKEYVHRLHKLKSMDLIVESRINPHLVSIYDEAIFFYLFFAMDKNSW